MKLCRQLCRLCIKNDKGDEEGDCFPNVLIVIITDEKVILIKIAEENIVQLVNVSKHEQCQNLGVERNGSTKKT